jgi:hypothetical protein
MNTVRVKCEPDKNGIVSAETVRVSVVDSKLGHEVELHTVQGLKLESYFEDGRYKFALLLRLLNPHLDLEVPEGQVESDVTHPPPALAKLQIEQLEEELHKVAGLLTGTREQLATVVKARDEVLAERDTAGAQAAKLETALAETKARIRELEAQLEQLTAPAPEADVVTSAPATRVPAKPAGKR